MSQLREVTPAELPAHAARFPGPQPAMVMAAIAAGNTAGRLWVAETAGALLWDRGNKVFYLAGAFPPALTAEAAALLAGPVRAEMRRRREHHFAVCALDAELETRLPDLFTAVPLQAGAKVFHALPPGPPPQAPAPRVAGVRLVAIDQRLLEADDLAQVAEVRAEVDWMWPTRERFYAHGFGVAAQLDGALIGWCTAEYVSQTQCGIGITTHPDYERQGVATALTAHFVTMCRQRGLAPHWECARRNTASMRVAAKAGFIPITEARFWHGQLPE